MRYLGWSSQGAFLCSVENSVWDLRHLQRALKERKEGSWQLFLLERTPKDFFVPARRAWAFVWLSSWGAACVQPCVRPPPPDCASLQPCLPSLPTKLTGTAPGIWPVESRRSLHLRPGHAVLSRAPRQMGHADRTPPGVQGRARPARSRGPLCPSPLVSICALRASHPALLPAAFASPGGSAAAGPGPDSRAVPSVAEAWSEEQDACRVEPRGAVTPAPGKRVGGGGWAPGLAAVGLVDPQ